MTTSDTNLSQLVINELTKEQYASITPEANQLYLVTDEYQPIHNIGEIVTSTVPLTDAGLHLLDGSLLTATGIYSAFVTYIAGLVSTYSNLFTTESNWQTSVTTYGVCGKFVYDSTNNTVRLPKIAGFTESTVSPTTLGDLTEAGLPNITGSTDETSSIGLVSRLGATQSGAFTKGEDRSYAPSGSTSVAGSCLGFDASLSNSIYGNSSTVQPQSIKVLYYIVVANSAKTDIQVDIDEIATDLNGKVDKSSLSEIIPVIETYKSGNQWYRIWAPDSTGYRWCEQGALYYKGATIAGDNTVLFLKEFVDISYSFIPTAIHSAANVTASTLVEKYLNRTTTQTTLYSPGAVFGYSWVARGYIKDEVS